MTSTAQSLPQSLKSDLLTVNDWIRYGATLFQKSDLYYGHGTDNAWDESAQLVLWVIATPWGRLEQVGQTRLATAEKEVVMVAFERRVTERLPAPYITGLAYFCDLDFVVDSSVLIPRSPIAELIQQGFQPWLEAMPDRILDLCTGSGCIGIACAYAFPDADVVLSDISAEALAIADKNIKRHHLEDQVRTVTSDLFAHIPDQFDLIVTNPPYVDAQDMASLPNEFLHEPTLALASGEDGLDFTRRLLAQAADHLTEQGVLIVEVGNSWEALELAFPTVPFTWIEFEHGGFGVFLLGKQQLLAHSDAFA